MIYPKFVQGKLAGGLPFVRFGEAAETLVIFPGVIDSLRPVTSIPQYVSWFFSPYVHSYNVCIISRKQELPTGYTTREMARDYAEAIDEIGRPVHVLALSMGAMIAQHLAVDFPEKVRGLVLSLGSSRSIPQTIKLARHWIELTRCQSWDELFAESVDTSFTGLHRVLWRRLMPILIRQPETPADFIVSLEACIQHDARARLNRIKTPTLVLGGKKDLLVPEFFYQELADLIPNAKLCLFEKGGHGLYQEQKNEFESEVMRFLNSI